MLTQEIGIHMQSKSVKAFVQIDISRKYEFIFKETCFP